jgi:protein-L-isoaspartate O-methyltransferase
MFRFLSEEHIPFAVSDNMDWLGKREFDLVIATDWAPPELSQYLAKGGRLLVVSPRQPEITTPRVITTHKSAQSYFRVRNYDLFPSLKLTNLIMLDGD